MAIWAGIAGGAAAYGQQQQAQQDDARWLERYNMMQASQQQQEQARQRYIAALRPPETNQLHTTDESGQPIVQQREWVAPSDDDITAGRSGSWRVAGTTPDINFERLKETQAQNDEKNKQAEERLRMQGEVNAARAEAAAARGSGGGGSGFSFKDYASAPPEQRALYDRYRRGESDPADEAAKVEREAKRKADMAAREQTVKDIREMSKPTEGKKATALYENQVMMGADPWATAKGASNSTAPAPMGQFAGKSAAAGGHGKVVRTGTKNGRRVVMYEDGTIADAQ